MTPPETALATRIKSIFATVFTAEGWTLADDRQVRAAGKDGNAFGLYPVLSTERNQQVQELQITYIVQFYLAYNADPDEFIVVDPNVVVGYADRLRRGFTGQSSGNTADQWYLRATQTAFPADPTGNMSRFEMTVLGFATNPAAFAQ